MSLLSSIIPDIDKKLPLINRPIWLYLPNIQCNFKCQYCYMSRNTKPRGSCSHSCQFILPKNINENNKWIVLYGGEILTDKPLVYSLILEIRKHTLNPISFSTNGSLLEAKDIDFFEKNNVKISLSYDGKYQKYRGTDILKIKKDIIYNAISRNVIISLNTVIHNKNYHDYKFDLPGISIIHDYNYIYPIETESNKSFLLENNLSDEISNNIVNLLKKLLLDIPLYDTDKLLLKYPPSIFYFLEQFLSLKKNKELSLTQGLLCSQTSCSRSDIYGNTFYACGKGLEALITKAPIDNACLNCKFLSMCAYKCPTHNFNRQLCKNTYMYKTYEKTYNLLRSLGIMD